LSSSSAADQSGSFWRGLTTQEQLSAALKRMGKASPLRAAFRAAPSDIV